MKFLLLPLLLLSANQAQAWWNTPYGYGAQRGGYWPNAWPAYVQPQQYGNNRNGWNVRGTMNQRGDTHFIMEYHGNIYNDQFVNPYGQSLNRGYPSNPYYGYGRR